MYINDNPLSKTFNARRKSSYEPSGLKSERSNKTFVFVLILFSVFQFSYVFGQYERTLTPGRSWKVSGFHHYFDVREMDSLFVNGNIELEGHEYSVIGLLSEGFYTIDTIALMREDTIAGKVWLRYYNQDYPPIETDTIMNQEYLVADYSLDIGDTVTYTYIADVQYSFYPIEVLLTVVDTGNVAGRHYVELNSTADSITGSLSYYGFTSFYDGFSYYAVDHIPLRFYEGVGPSQGPIAPLGGSGIYPADSYLTCAYDDGVQIWSDPEVSSCDLPAYWVSDELRLNSEDTNIEIYPNPNNGSFRIQIGDHYDGKEYILEIHSIDSRIINTQKGRVENNQIKWRLTTPTLGLYLLTLKINSEMHVLKFIISTN